MQYGNWVIPPGTAVGMDSYHMHTNPHIFPDPFVFRPERWLNDPRGPDGRQPLTHYLTTFGSGSRICIAMHLAYMELYVTLATILRRHEFQLFGTDRSDVEFALEMLAPMPHWGSRGDPEMGTGLVGADLVLVVDFGVVSVLCTSLGSELEYNNQALAVAADCHVLGR
jgi:hypothetical protein